MDKGPKDPDHQREASKATAKYRAANAMPKGTQVQHWTKVRSAKATGMSTDRMNQNISTLQSRNSLPATTLLTSKDGKSGTKYTVHQNVDRKGESKVKAASAKAAGMARGKFAAMKDAALSKPTKSYGNEHKFADKHMIPAEKARIKASNPSINKQDAAEAAGASAKWKMTGDPGNVSPGLVEKIDLSKGEKPRQNARQGPVAKTDGGPQSAAKKSSAAKPSNQAPSTTSAKPKPQATPPKSMPPAPSRAPGAAKPPGISVNVKTAGSPATAPNFNPFGKQ